MAWSEWKNVGSMKFKQCVSGVMSTNVGTTVTGTLTLPITLEKGTHKIVAFIKNYRGGFTIVTSNVVSSGYELTTDFAPNDGYGTLQKHLEITVDTETTLNFVFSYSSTLNVNHGENPICVVTDYI